MISCYNILLEKILEITFFCNCELLQFFLLSLKSDLSKCQELHQIANDAKEKLQQMQKDCLMKIDENCTALTEKHKIEVTH